MYSASYTTNDGIVHGPGLSHETLLVYLEVGCFHFSKLLFPGEFPA